MTGKQIALGTVMLALVTVALAAVVSVFLERTARADFLLAASVGGFVLLIGAAFLLVNESTSTSMSLPVRGTPAPRVTERDLHGMVERRMEEGRNSAHLSRPALMLVMAGLLILLCSFIAGQAVRLLW